MLLVCSSALSEHVDGRRSRIRKPRDPAPARQGDCEKEITAMGFVIADVRKRWRQAIASPTFCDEDLSNKERSAIGRAMRIWERRTSVRFVQRTTQDRFVRFIPDPMPMDGVCSSTSIGMEGGEQQILIDPTAPRGTALHEIGHALGFYHEHQRPDRAPFINVNANAISPNRRSQFQVVRTNATTVTRYDLDSIMHYPSATAFSTNGTTPIITTDSSRDRFRIRSTRRSLNARPKRLTS